MISIVKFINHNYFTIFGNLKKVVRNLFMKSNIFDKPIIRGIVLLFLVIIVIVYLQYTWIINKKDQVYDVVQTARSFVATLSKDDVKAIDAMSGEIDKSHYHLIKNKLKAIIDVNTEAGCAYIYTFKNNKIYFLADSKPENSMDSSFPGQEYLHADTVYKQPIEDNNGLITGPVSGRWGRCRSVLIPIKEEATGRTIAVFGMDYNIVKWNFRLIYELVESSLLIFSLLLALLFLIKIKSGNKSLKREIAERKQAAGALAHSHDLMRYIIEHNRSSISVHDRDLKYIYVSQRYLEDYNIKERAIIGKHHYEVFPDLPQKWRDVHQKALSGQILSAEEDVYVNADGTEVWTRWECRPWYQADNSIGGIILYTEVITEKKKMEDAFRQNEETYHSILKASPDLITITDLEGRILMGSQVALKMFGFDRIEEAIGRSFSDFIIPGDRERAKVNIGLHLQGVDQPPGEYMGLRSDGSTFNLEVNGDFIRDEEGRPIKIVFILRDTSERKRIENELLDSEERNKVLLQANPDIMFVLDREGVFVDSYSGNLAPLYASPGFFNGKNVSEIMPPKVAQIIQFYLDRIFSTGQMQIFTYQLEMNGEKKDYECRLVLNRNSRALAIVRDVTEQKQKECLLKERNNELIHKNEELIKARDKAEESDRLKSAFLANMSHEIRTPMNSIIGFAELLKEPDLSDKEQHEYISIIEESGTRMLNIINDIVEISKIESGVMQVNLKNSNLNEQVEYIYRFFKPEVEAKGMQLFWHNNLPAEKAMIRTDREKLYAILINLVKNAIKYSEKGSIELGYNKNNHYVEFYVKDSGIGIPKEKQETIFNRFVQAEMGMKRPYDGVGLGLSISKAYIEMLGGKIWLKSEPGIGSTFYFTLPIDGKAGEIAAANEKAISFEAYDQVEKLKILIAEDDEKSAIFIAKLLKPFSKRILKAKTGTEALGIFRNNPDIDLIMMDIQMPDMDGYDATRKIREFNNEVVIIAQTALAFSHDREKALKSGCTDYISKPVTRVIMEGILKKYFINNSEKTSKWLTS
jgi:PAS domain S-box-containing protein